jgi:hypothetical protein
MPLRWSGWLSKTLNNREVTAIKVPISEQLILFKDALGLETILFHNDVEQNANQLNSMASLRSTARFTSGYTQHRPRLQLYDDFRRTP